LSTFVLLTHRPPISTLFPYTTLFRSCEVRIDPPIAAGGPFFHFRDDPRIIRRMNIVDAPRWRAIRVRPNVAGAAAGIINRWPQTDRKSTRLNSSHVEISYAVFCLKKK